MERTRSYYQENPRRPIILAPYAFCIRFTCKGLKLSLALRSSQGLVIIYRRGWGGGFGAKQGEI